MEISEYILIITSMIPAWVAVFANNLSSYRKILLLIISVIILASPYIAKSILSICKWIKWTTIIIVKKIKLFWIKSKRIKIGLALHVDENSDILSYCNEKIASIGLSHKVKFVDATKKCSYKNTHIVEKFLDNKSSMDLIIWRRDSSLSVSKKKVPINFTHRSDHARVLGRLLQNELSSLVSRRDMFKLFEDTYHVDLELEKHNISFFGLYIIAISVASFRGAFEGLAMFELLYKEIKEKRLYAFEKMVQSKLQNCLNVIGTNYYYKGKYPPAKEYLEISYNLNQKNPETMAALAVTRFKLDDKDGAESLVYRLINEYPNFPISALDIAFFMIIKKRYTKALKHYVRYKKLSPDPSISLEAIVFFSERIEKEPSEIAYLFARGFLKSLVEEDNFREDLLSFINRGKNITAYIPMIDLAQDILDRKNRIRNKVR